MFDEMFAGPLARRIRRENLTYLPYDRLRSLRKAAREVRSVPGAVVETGVALGGSGILLANELQDREFHGYDVFDEFPSPGPDDPPEAHEVHQLIVSGEAEGPGQQVFTGRTSDWYERVADAFGRYGVPLGDRIHLHKGLVQDTFNPDGPIALAHIDTDWYDPVKICLERIAPYLQPGARVILDDYYDYSGCKKATDEFVSSVPGFKVVRHPGHMVLGYQPAGK
jgi:O-methyltransferase